MDGVVMGHFCGYPSHIDMYLQKNPDHTVVWLEPENEYDPDTYYERIVN
jgi:hypothetical protein